MHSPALTTPSGLLGSATNLLVLPPNCRQLRSTSPAVTRTSNHSPALASVSLALYLRAQYELAGRGDLGGA